MKPSPYYDLESVARAVAQGQHRDVIGGLWEELGHLQLEFLKRQGLRPAHRLVDVGCGCLRAGVGLVRYLDPGNYLGLDMNQALLDAGYDRELAAAGLQDKLPRENLVCNATFDFSEFSQPFDYALGQSLFTHLTFNHIRLCLERLALAMKPGARLFATYFERTASWPEGDRVEHRGGITTFSAADPYHYYVADFAHICESLPWTLVPVGDWNHPRGQKMLGFVFEPDRRPPTCGPAPDVMPA